MRHDVSVCEDLGLEFLVVLVLEILVLVTSLAVFRESAHHDPTTVTEKFAAESET